MLSVNKPRLLNTEHIPQSFNLSSPALFFYFELPRTIDLLQMSEYLINEVEIGSNKKLYPRSKSVLVGLNSLYCHLLCEQGKFIK